MQTSEMQYNYKIIFDEVPHVVISAVSNAPLHLNSFLSATHHLEPEYKAGWDSGRATHLSLLQSILVNA